MTDAPIYDVGADHQILSLGRNRMVLFDTGDRPSAVGELPGEVIVAAERKAPGGEWTVTVELEDTDIEPVTAKDRPAAIQTMTEQALKALPGEGYSTRVPRGLAEAP